MLHEALGPQVNPPAYKVEPGSRVTLSGDGDGTIEYSLDQKTWKRWPMLGKGSDFADQPMWVRPSVTSGEIAIDIEDYRYGWVNPTTMWKSERTVTGPIFNRMIATAAVAGMSTAQTAALVASSLPGFDGSYPSLTDKPTLFSGSYTDLTDKPTQFSGAYADLTGKPVLFSGDYSDLTNKPSVFALGTPAAKTVAVGTAYQAMNSTKPAMVTVNLTSTSNLTLSGGTTASADIVVGSTNAVASGTGTVVGKYSNGLTGTLVVGLAINAVQTTPFAFALPVGWWFAIRQTAGTVSVVSAFEQAFT